MPNALRVFIHFAYTMKRHPLEPALTVNELKCFRTFRREGYFHERNHDYPLLASIIVSQLEVAPGELRVPLDAVEYFVDRDHLAVDEWRVRQD